MHISGYPGIGLIPGGSDEVAAIAFFPNPDVRGYWSNAPVVGRVTVLGDRVWHPGETSGVTVRPLSPRLVDRLLRNGTPVDMPDDIVEMVNGILGKDLLERIVGGTGAVSLIVFNNGGYEGIKRFVRHRRWRWAFVR